jgi:hypothetical protein
MPLSSNYLTFHFLHWCCIWRQGLWRTPVRGSGPSRHPCPSHSWNSSRRVLWSGMLHYVRGLTALALGQVWFISRQKQSHTRDTDQFSRTPSHTSHVLLNDCVYCPTHRLTLYHCSAHYKAQHRIFLTVLRHSCEATGNCSLLNNNSPDKLKRRKRELTLFQRCANSRTKFDGNINKRGLRLISIPYPNLP